MSTVPFSLRMTPEIKEQLEQEAGLLDRSSSYIALQAIKDYLQNASRKRQAIDAALEEADKGVFISQQAMNDWVDSWGTADEMEPPKPDIYPEKSSV